MAQLEKLLSFPEEAVQAARRFALEKWRLDKEYTGNLVTAVECEISNNFQSTSIDYGVADAILSGKRIRLLNEFTEENLGMNCAEVGVNAFLIYSSFTDTHMVLMRYNDGQPSDHFAVLNYDSGLDEMPTILDPLFGFSGRANFTADGFIHIPINLLNIRSKNLPAKEEQREISYHLDEEDMEKRIVTRPIFMSIDDVMRHINYVNSPLGFFDYFRRGQKIMSEKKSGISEIEFNAKMIGDCLRISATHDSLFPDLVTFQRDYHIDKEGALQFADRRILHMGYRWVEPQSVVYTESRGSSHMMHPNGNRKYSNHFFLYLINFSFSLLLFYLSDSLFYCF